MSIYKALNWHATSLAQHAETASKIMACAAIFSLVLPTAWSSIFLALFLIFSIIGGNYKFKFELIINNSVALLAIAIFMFFVISLTYTSAPDEDALELLRKYGKFIYIPFLLAAFHEQRWKRAGYIAFLAGVSLMLMMSYMTLLGWSPESMYSGSYAQDSPRYHPHIVFRSSIAHGTLMAYAAYLYLLYALDESGKIMRVFFFMFAALASFNILFMVASRVGQLLWVVLMLLAIYQHRGWKYMSLGLVVIPVLAITMVAFSDKTRFRWLELKNDIELVKQGDYSSSFGLRAVWAESGWDIFKRHPIVGTGVGSFKEEFTEHAREKEATVLERLSTHNPHNEYVSVGVQLGAVGLVLFIALLIQQWRISNYLPLFSSYAAKGMVLTVVVSSCMHSFVYSHTQGVFFALFAALFFSSCCPDRRTDNSH